MRSGLSGERAVVDRRLLRQVNEDWSPEGRRKAALGCGGGAQSTHMRPYGNQVEAGWVLELNRVLKGLVDSSFSLECEPSVPTHFH